MQTYHIKQSVGPVVGPFLDDRITVRSQFQKVEGSSTGQTIELAGCHHELVRVEGGESDAVTVPVGGEKC